jgi:hypothetical protein
MAHRLPLADIQFIADFAAFARAKGDATYVWHSASTCALAQFGYPEVVDWQDAGIPCEAYHAAVLDTETYEDDATFSALADRLEALIADAPVVERGQ